jgi:hypothetical protein
MFLVPTLRRSNVSGSRSGGGCRKSHLPEPIEKFSLALGFKKIAIPCFSGSSDGSTLPTSIRSLSRYCSTMSIFEIEIEIEMKIEIDKGYSTMPISNTISVVDYRD